ncbi:MAG TPA: histidine decarboxylase [Devosia sp.]|jgi:histidine decarboxylase|uniref:histidine decarboxylase n=1 Tax=Devosia sp. TaxID=1871048 RepID=UPI002DDD9FFC|nr:histidine decarboxylase [Devosia sp.]HEV2515306.1 histidine decarboxylase [Devosia sp.]
MIVEAMTPGALVLPRPTADHLTLARIENRLKTAHANHLGYPYNLAGDVPAASRFAGYLVNNLGDPYAGSHYGSEVCDLEREVVDWLMELWQCDNRDDYWGSVGASGTEGNFWALYLAREAFPDAILVYPREAHYSIPKSARILRMTTQTVDCEPSGEVSLSDLRRVLSRLRSAFVIVALTCGTTVKGAHDDIAGAMAVLEDCGFPAQRRFVHVDGALNAMVLPFLEGVPDRLQPSFRHGIDSLSTSGHKMIGTTMPCGVLVTLRRHVERVASAVAYLRSNDTTLMGSRNGHAVLALWARLFGHGRLGFRRDAERCVARATRLAEELRDAGVPVLLNPHALTVLFPQPSEDIIKRYQLACTGDDAHAIIMPNVTEQLAARFTSDYLAWWDGR